MGKKKQQVQHITQSMGQMVSKAALVQLQEPISMMVNNLGQRLALKQAENTQTMFTRIVAIEKVLIDKGVLTQEDLQLKVADIEDSREGLINVDDALATGDTARIQVRTKEIADETFESGVTRLKIGQTGTGNTLGTEVELGIVGMKVGETKVITFADGKLNAEIKIDRISRPVPPPKPLDAPLNVPTETSTQEGTDASPNQIQG